jgi:predicted dehydrogenase
MKAAGSIKTVVVVGCGSMGRRRIRHAKELARARVVAWDIRADRRREVAEQFGVETVVAESEIYRCGADAMFISVPPADHMHYIEKAIEHAMPFMVEQPISHRLDKLDDIVEKVRDRRLVCHVSCNQRFSPRVLAIKKVLEAGRVGQVLTGTVELGEWLPDWHPYEPYQDYYPSSRAKGGGLDAICDLDWLFFLFGPVRDAKTMCSKRSRLEIDTDDVVQMLLDFRDGPQLALHTDMLQRPFSRQSRFVCTNGTVVHDHPDQFLKIYYADERCWEEVPFGADLSRYPHMQGKPAHGFAEPMYQADSQAFLDRLANRDAATDSLENAIANLRFTLSQIRPERD